MGTANHIVLFKSAPVEKKSVQPAGTQSFYSFLYNGGWQSLSAYQSILYYQQVAPLFTAIDIICQEIMAIEPIVYDKRKKKYIDQHAILDLLNKPNTDSTYSEFIYRFVAFYLLTGNNYCMATGPINRPPLELCIVPPQAVTIAPANDGYAQIFSVNLYNTSFTFSRMEEKSRFRFVNDNGEMYQTKTFNPVTGPAGLYGMSRLTPIYYEIEQYIQASIHNLSMLEKGANPSLILTSSESLTDDQFQRLQQQLNLFYAGARNNGRAMLLENGFTPSKMTMTNKDMDFAKLKENITFTIYNALRIPLPKVSPENMTLANMETAKLDLYDNAVIPIVKTVFQELTNFLMPRYKNSENLAVSFDPGAIVALEPRRNEQLKLLKELNIYKINELRNMAGDEDVEGGDDIYKPSSEKPIRLIAQGGNEQENDEAANDDELSDDELTALLQEQFDDEGKRLFSDAEIKSMVSAARKYG